MTVLSLLDHLHEIKRIVDSYRVGLMVDFDGTIAPIGATPQATKMSNAAANRLELLSRKIEMVCVISGRQVEDLKQKVELPGVTLVGSHGAEYMESGMIEVELGVDNYREHVSRTIAHLKNSVDDPLITWIDKGFGASVHFRNVSNTELVGRRLETALSESSDAKNLETYWGKMVLEIVPPGGYDKGFAVRKLQTKHNLDAIIFLGDDTTDKHAMEALQELKIKQRIAGVAVAVLHPDTSDDLLVHADYTLSGVDGVEQFLKWLVNNVNKKGGINR